MGGNAGGTYSVAKISVWWDIEKCRVPRGHDANKIAKNITSALININYGGPVSISAYGDTNTIPQPIQHALSSTGVSLNHVPTAAGYKTIIVDMLLWAVDNPAPANYLLISGDNDFSNALHQLSMRKYNILLAHPPHLSTPSLSSAAKVVWLWTTLSSAGPPIFVSHPDSTLPLQPKPKLQYFRKIIPIDTHTKTNDTQPPPPPPPPPPRKIFFGAPHEFFATKCNDPVNPTSATKFDNEILIPLRDSQQYPLRQRLNEIPSCQQTPDNSDYNVENLVDVIVKALNFLKVEMIFPSETNITDCVRYGDPKYQTIDVRMVLDFAIQKGRVVKRVFGAMHLYLAAKDTLWNCVNHFSGHPNDFPPQTWGRVKQFLASSSGRSLILISRCRFEASLTLKKLCLEEVVLGDVLKMLEMMIRVKKWIIHHHSGWQPITIRVKESKSDAYTDSDVDLDQI